MSSKAGIGYTLYDGINPPYRGEIGDDGLLVYDPPSQSTRCVIFLDDEAEPLVFHFNPTSESDEDAEEGDLDTLFVQDMNLAAEDDEEFLEDPAESEENEPMLCLLIPEKAGKRFKLTVGDSVVQGDISDDGELVCALTSEAQRAILEIEAQQPGVFEDPIELKFQSGEYE